MEQDTSRSPKASQGPDDMVALRALADRFDLVLEEDFQLLAGATPGTVEAWRKRGVGPAYIRLGRRYFYPRQQFVEHLNSRIQTRAEVPGKAVL
jgi:hypothetical protein